MTQPLSLEPVTPRSEGREPLDAYYTPQDLAEAVIERLIADGFITRHTHEILEPSLGNGAWALAMSRIVGRSVWGVELDKKRAEDSKYWSGVRSVYHDDFLMWECDKNRFDLCIGNPPFARGTGRISARTGKEITEHIAPAHVSKALDVAHTVAFLLRLAFLAPKTDRRELWEKHPCARIYVLDPRPSFVGGGTDNSDYGVFVWSKGNTENRVVPMRWK